MRLPILPITAIGLCLAVLFLTGVKSGPQAILPNSPDDDLFELRKNFEIFGALYEEVVVNYVDQVHPQPFMKTGVDAMLADLDPYTRFYDQADNMDIAQMQSGPQATVGLNIGMEGGMLTVLAPESINSGYRRGVQIGDRLVSVDGVSVDEITVRDVVVLLRGEEGTIVELVFEREGEALPVSFQLQREVPERGNISYAGYLGPDSTDRIGYVRLDTFGPRAAREVKRAFRSMIRGGGLNGAVLDLRNNPGGLVSEAVELVGLFVPKGTLVVSIQGRDESRHVGHSTADDPFMSDIPLVILVNEFSASSSEIVSGALQDLDRAVIVGSTTFGKGLVQVGKALPYNSSMRITIGHYYTPRGRDLQSRRISSRSAQISRPSIQKYRTISGRPVRSGVGIEPDVMFSEKEKSEFHKALIRDGAFFKFAGYWVRENHSSPDTRKLYDSFSEWLNQEGFLYLTEAEKSLNRASASLSEVWDPGIADAIQLAQEGIREQKNLDLQRGQEELSEAVLAEVQSRLLDRDVYIQVRLQADQVANEALQIVIDKSRYHSILTL